MERLIAPRLEPELQAFKDKGLLLDVLKMSTSLGQRTSIQRLKLQFDFNLQWMLRTLLVAKACCPNSRGLQQSHQPETLQ